MKFKNQIPAHLPFTKLFINNNKQNIDIDIDIDNMSSWLENEFKKTSLPQMPNDIWRHILTFVPADKRNDAVILGNQVVIVPDNCEGCCGRRSCGNGVYKILSVNAFIKQYGHDEINKIHIKSFGSECENIFKAMNIFYGKLKIETVLAM